VEGGTAAGAAPAHASVVEPRLRGRARDTPGAARSQSLPPFCGGPTPAWAAAVCPHCRRRRPPPLAPGPTGPRCASARGTGDQCSVRLRGALADLAAARRGLSDPRGRQRRFALVLLDDLGNPVQALRANAPTQPSAVRTATSGPRRSCRRYTRSCRGEQTRSSCAIWQAATARGFSRRALRLLDGDLLRSAPR